MIQPRIKNNHIKAYNKRSLAYQSVLKYLWPKWLGATGWTSEVRIFIFGKAFKTLLTAKGVQKRLAKKIFSSRTRCSRRTLTALMTVFPDDMIGYMSITFRSAMSSGNLAYTTWASCVSKSLSTRIFPIRIDRQQSLKPENKQLFHALLHCAQVQTDFLKGDMCVTLLHGFTAPNDAHTTVSFLVT